ncbi:hypothetical protein SH449x_000873 [Pirellulaceae bacterium SH449]
MTNIYAVLSDMGLHPAAYGVTTIGEVKSFIDGYQFAIKSSNHSLAEVPPFRQFSEWLVRRLARGNRSLGWWQIIKWGNIPETAAISDFATLITEFARRLPRVMEIARLDEDRNEPTGEFQFGFISEGKYTSLTANRPHLARIVQYATDDGVYLEYHYDRLEYETYCDSFAVAQARAHADFRIEIADWILDAMPTQQDRT